MHYFVLLVLHDIDRLDQILSAWENAGVDGITVMASTGLGRIRTKIALREDIPLIPSLNDLLEESYEELLNRTLFSIVDNEEIIDRIHKATEGVLGSLTKPRTGILAVIPIARVYGLKSHVSNKGKVG
jgi:nitrogen regulatory protein P-II 1